MSLESEALRNLARDVDASFAFRSRVVDIAIKGAERIEVLDEALSDALSGLRYVRAHYPEVSGVGFDRCEEYRALIPKQDCGIIGVDEFRLPAAQETHTFWIVWKRNNPPHFHPRRRHPTRESALEEAKRLSLKFPDSKIYVLEASAKFLAGVRVDYPVPSIEPLPEVFV